MLRFTLAIVGSRRGFDTNVATDVVQAFIRLWKYRRPQLDIISGGASGIDTIAEQQAIELQVPFEAYLSRQPTMGTARIQRAEHAYR